MERGVQPGPEVAVDEQLMSQQRNQIGQGPAEGGTELKVFQHEHGDQRGPDLGFDGVSRGPQERLHLQTLLQGFEI